MNVHYNAMTENFIKKMTKKDFGTFVILGDSDVNKNDVFKKYLSNAPDNVRKVLIADRNSDKNHDAEDKNLAVFSTKSHAEALKTNSSLHDSYELGGILSIFKDAIRMRVSMIAIDTDRINMKNIEKSKTNSIDSKKFKKDISELISSITMLSENTNIALNVNANSISEFMQIIENILIQRSSPITMYGFLRQIKGIALIKTIEFDGRKQDFIECLEFNHEIITALVSDKDMESKEKTIDILRKQSKNVSIQDQLLSNQKPEVNYASRLVHKNFMDNNNGLALISGPAGVGKTTALRSFIKDNINSGKRGILLCGDEFTEYFDLSEKQGFDMLSRININLGYEGIKQILDSVTKSIGKIDYIVFDELRQAEDAGTILELSKDYPVITSTHSHFAYGALMRITNLLMSQENVFIEESIRSENDKVSLKVWERLKVIFELSFESTGNKDYYERSRKSRPFIITDNIYSEIKSLIELGFEDAGAVVNEMSKKQGF